jgi:putative transposase
MSRVYGYINSSRQAFHQKLDRQLRRLEYEAYLTPILQDLRTEHPGVAARQLYTILQPEQIGRDRFEALCFQLGLRLDRKKAFKRTTDSSGVIRFVNLVTGREFTGINQVWVSDITYYQIGNDFYYLTFIMDLYSRKIVGYSVSERLITEATTLPALHMAIKARQPQPGMIFHSDGGGQYYSKAFVELTGQYGIHNSMCDSVFENANAERINGTIKNQYIKGYDPTSYYQLIKATDRAVRNYNYVRPHSMLGKTAPGNYEQYLLAEPSKKSVNVIQA